MDTRCPCGSGRPYDVCCGRLHRGAAHAATAEELMRSRYSAFAVGDAAYLRDTWDPATRPPSVHVDRTVRWLGLEVLGTTGGGLLEPEGTVAFRARYDGGVVEEDSRFVRVAGRWAYTGPA